MSAAPPVPLHSTRGMFSLRRLITSRKANFPPSTSTFTTGMPSPVSVTNQSQCRSHAHLSLIGITSTLKWFYPVNNGWNPPTNMLWDFPNPKQTLNFTDKIMKCFARQVTARSHRWDNYYSVLSVIIYNLILHRCNSKYNSTQSIVVDRRINVNSE